MRDIRNISSALRSIKDYQYVQYDNLSQETNSFPDICKDFVSKVIENDIVLVYLSGHGYQTSDSNGDEKDGYDEYIMTKFGRVLDDQIHELLIRNLPDSVQFIGISDTCHSGTMYDLEEEISLNSRYNCLSIGACSDSELENCDIGENVGYGGALTIQLLENEYDGYSFLEYIIRNFSNVKGIINLKRVLSDKLSVFRQHPVINCLSRFKCQQPPIRKSRKE